MKLGKPGDHIVKGALRCCVVEKEKMRGRALANCRSMRMRMMMTMTMKMMMNDEAMRRTMQVDRRGRALMR